MCAEKFEKIAEKKIQFSFGTQIIPEKDPSISDVNKAVYHGYFCMMKKAKQNRGKFFKFF